MNRVQILAGILFFIFAGSAYGQMTEEEIESKNKEIIEEGTLLYRYEKAAWLGTDIALEESDIRDKFSGYLVYEVGDSIRLIAKDPAERCILELTFPPEFDSAPRQDKTIRDLTPGEAELWKIKDQAFANLETGEYEFMFVPGYTFNGVLIPNDDDTYKFYLISGTNQSYVIPFGNDRLFVCDKEGAILSHTVFHKELFPLMVMNTEGSRTEKLLHAHDISTPLITPTDICTFRIYAENFAESLNYYDPTETGKLEFDEFTIYSPALSRYFTYSISKNSISSKPAYE